MKKMDKMGAQIKPKMTTAQPKIALNKRPRSTPENELEKEIQDMKAAQAADRIRLANLLRFQPESTRAIEALKDFIDTREKILRGA